MTFQASRMDLEDREELRSAVLRALDDGVASTRRCWEDTEAWRQPWEAAVRLDLPGLLAPEASGGSGADVSVLVVALESSGRTLAPVPLRTTAANSVPLLMNASGPGPEEVLAQILATGSACASADAGDWDGLSTVVLPVVADASRCELILVRLGECVAVVESGECLISPSPSSADPSVPVARVEIPPALLLERSFPLPEFETPSAISRLGAAAELVGIATLGLDHAVGHSIERVQFDKPIAAFQSVKHRLADIFVSINRARGLVEHSALLLDVGDEAGIAVSHLAYAAAAEAAIESARTNVRLHGAMGATWELDAHLVLRRARHLTQLFGAPDEHYRLGAVKMEGRYP